VHDYAAGKVDWMARGLPVEGTDAGTTRAINLLRDDVVRCGLEDRVGAVAERIADSPYGFALALSDGGVVLGRVRRSRCDDGAATAEEVMELGPSTTRPDLTLEQLDKKLGSSAVKTLIISDPEGRLLGVVRRADVESHST
jgi:hypothetical protein